MWLLFLRILRFLWSMVVVSVVVYAFCAYVISLVTAVVVVVAVSLCHMATLSLCHLPPGLRSSVTPASAPSTARKALWPYQKAAFGGAGLKTRISVSAQSEHRTPDYLTPILCCYPYPETRLLPFLNPQHSVLAVLPSTTSPATAATTDVPSTPQPRQVQHGWVGKGQHRDEQRHGEPDPAKQAHADHRGPGDVSRQSNKSGPLRQPRGPHDADWGFPSSSPRKMPTLIGGERPISALLWMPA
ncbi:MAG: hypothetical protein QM765_44480 [Myxococcales bacterium]